MALVVPPGHSPIASEFLAEEALISIVPKFRHDKFQFITGTYGPFVPQRSVEVPLWLACRLSRSDMCTIIMPDWLTVENLTACKEEEISRIDTFSERVPKSYQETCAVLFEVDDTTADLHQIVEDIANVRATKIRSGVIGLAKSATLDETTHSVKMNSVGTAEVAAIRTQLSMSLNKFWALRKHQTKPLRNNGKRRDSRHDNNRTTTPVHTDETAPRRQLRRFRSTLQMVLRSLVLWSIVTRCTGYTSHSGVSLEQPSWARHNSISDFALQRAIQTQLFYMVSTRDGPKASWLARFMNHEHLDSTNGEERAAAMGEGGVGEGGDTFAYRARLGGLRTGHDQYLKELSNAPPEILRIEIAPSRSRMSTMERNNPFLANRKLESFFYDDEIDPRAVASRVALTASALAESWIDELDRQAVLDDERVYADSLENKAVRPYEGEFFKDDIDVDDSMPLFDHDKRALERFTTLQAAATLLDDLRNERDQTASLAANDDDEMVEEFDVNFLVGTRRRKEAAEELQSQGNKLHPKRQLKSQATLSYFESFVDVWCPRLVHGANDHLLAALGKAPPGLPRRQLFRQGFEGEADADEALEHLAMDRMPLKLPGGYLVNPTKLATTLRAYRANVAYDTKTNLVDFKNNIDAFRHTLSSN